ncbi:hypothetical protein M8997_002580 [Phyllobacterium sp. 21LDTY02-6]|jgi:hypothetical protein|uniref:hypothetical protein n=1 Tax=Phyllobacterium sp. 21LDTY02-6 TaxID=2944903 RepID=UPI002020AD85|nr:hypothetical protein [Phyllobacterium sp. 21LDTY02-6]MCO4316056.1 hypothetical protein [Phyllobacterium sp. 21LDTY02-6]
MSMSLRRNSKSGKQNIASVLLSIFWLVSTFGAAISAGYLAERPSNMASTEAADSAHARVSREGDNSSNAPQRTTRVAALETLHLKIKSGLKLDTGPQDAILPASPSLLFQEGRQANASSVSADLRLKREAGFHPRGPPNQA